MELTDSVVKSIIEEVGRKGKSRSGDRGERGGKHSGGCGEKWEKQEWR